MKTRTVKRREEVQRDGQITVAIYARVSLDIQDSESKVSMDEQVADAKKYCDEKGYRVYDVYQDVDHGWSKNRREFMRMIEDGKSGRYQRIICWRLDRLGRGLTPLIPLLDLIDNYGIEVDGVNQALSKDSLAILAMVGKMELDALRQRTAMGRRGAARKGRVPINSVPYGYYVDEDRRPQVNEAEAAVIREIFRLCTESNLGHRRVANVLNSRGVPSPGGGKKGWKDGTISGIVANEVYWTGIWYFGRTKTVMSQEDGQTIRNLILQPENEWIAIDFPTIVSEDVWHKARRHVESRTHFSPRNTRIFYLLQQMVTCEECGLSFNARSHGPIPGQDAIPKDERVRHRYYVCGGMNRGIGWNCRKRPSIRAELLESVVWGQFKRIIRCPSIMIDGVASQSEARGESHARLVAAIEKAESDKAEAEQGRNMVSAQMLRTAETDVLYRESLNEMFDELLAESEERLAAIDETLEDLWLRQESAQYQMNGDMFRDWAGNIEETLNTLDDEDRRSLLREVIEHITIDRNNRIAITAAVPVEQFVAFESRTSNRLNDARYDRRRLEAGREVCRLPLGCASRVGPRLTPHGRRRTWW